MKIVPSSFPDDPLGHVWNQLRHGAIGAGLVAIFPQSQWSVVFLVVGYAVLIEWPQIRMAGKRVVGDSVEDSLHFFLGAMIVFAVAWWAVPAWLVILGLGAWFRT